MRYSSHFPLFQSHLDLAHAYWSRVVQPGDHVIDATCGNGQDTRILCDLALHQQKGSVLAIDIQLKAIELTKSYLTQHLNKDQLGHIEYQHGCHSQFPDSILPQSVSLIIYNLGYLPGGDKNLTTQTATTLASLQHALTLIKPGGIISVTCYPGHTEGAHEQSAILEFANQLSPNLWSSCHHQWLNRKKSPSLLLIQKSDYFPEIMI